MWWLLGGGEWWSVCVQCVRGKNVAVCACDRGTYDCRRVGIASDTDAVGRAVVAAAAAVAAPLCAPAAVTGDDQTRPAPIGPEQEVGWWRQAGGVAIT